MTSSQDEEVSLVGCSVRGPKHEDAEEPCQDAWYGHRLPGGRFVIAVGDGLGSASRSHEGSQLATRKMADALREYLSGVEAIEREASESALREAVVDTRETVTDTAERLGEEPSAFNTTLLAVVGGPSGLAGVVVGDGGIVCQHEGDNEQFVSREMAITDTEFANVTVPLQSDHWEESIRIGYREEFDAVAVFSDGIDEFVWEGLDDVKDAFFDQVFDHVWTVSDDDEAAEQLHNYLNNDHYRKYSSDDKTLAIGALERPEDTVDETVTEPADDGDEQATTEPADQAEREDSTVDTDESGAERDDDLAGSPVDDEPEEGGSASPFQRAETSEERVVDTVDGNDLELGTKLIDDTDSTVHRLESEDSLAVKLFTQKEEPHDETERKIRAMIANPPTETSDPTAVPRFAWPTTVVTDENDGFLGYLMPFPEVERSSDLFEHAREAPQQSTAEASGFFDRVSNLVVDTHEPAVDHRYRSAFELARALETLHQAGVAVGGLRHTDGLVTDGAVSLVSCDSYYIQVDDETFTGAGFDPRYAPPEARFETMDTVRQADEFGLGILIFQLVMNGTHPFRAQGSEAVEGSYAEMIQSNPFPYRDPRPGQLEPPDDAPRYDEVPAALRAKFETCFVEGKHNPGLRPTASEWASALESLDGNVRA